MYSLIGRYLKKFKFVYSHIFSEDILMDIEKKAITEEDVHNWKRRRLRVAKSAESLINLPNRDHRLSRHYKNICYMTINILDSDWTKHYFTLHFKMCFQNKQPELSLLLFLSTRYSVQK
jgi:hypothetical protein